MNSSDQLVGYRVLTAQINVFTTDANYQQPTYDNMASLASKLPLLLSNCSPAFAFSINRYRHLVSKMMRLYIDRLAETNATDYIV